MTLGRRLNRWRLAKGLSEREAARRVGVSQPTWRRVEGDDFADVSVRIAALFVRAVSGVKLEHFVPRKRQHATAEVESK